jgi:hypothetical protein
VFDGHVMNCTVTVSGFAPIDIVIAIHIPTTQIQRIPEHPAVAISMVHNIAVSVGCINDRNRLQQGPDQIIRRTGSPLHLRVVQNMLEPTL